MVSNNFKKSYQYCDMGKYDVGKCNVRFVITRL